MSTFFGSVQRCYHCGLRFTSVFDYHVHMGNVHGYSNDIRGKWDLSALSDFERRVFDATTTEGKTAREIAFGAYPDFKWKDSRNGARIAQIRRALGSLRQGRLVDCYEQEGDGPSFVDRTKWYRAAQP